MKIEDIESLQDRYHAMKKAVKELALEKIKARDLAANKGRQSSFIRYLVLDEFYVEDGVIHLRFGFHDPAPYSGSEEVELTQSELEGI